MSAWFFIAAAGMVAAALALIAPPLFSRRPDGEKSDGEAERRTQNIAAARRRMRDLRERRENGEISEDDFAEARAEIERALLDDLAAQGEARVSRALRRQNREGGGGGEGEKSNRESPRDESPRGKWFAAALCFALPMAAGILYLHLGEPRALFPPEPNRSGPNQSAAAPTMDAAIAALRARLGENPRDPAGWILLARSLATTGQFGDAAEAFAQARNLTGDDADLLAGEAESRARAADGNFSGKPERLLSRALELDSENPTALWLSGLAAAGRDDLAAAAGFWKRALPQIRDAEAKSQLQNLIAEAEAESAISKSNSDSNFGSDSNSSSDFGSNSSSDSDSDFGSVSDSDSEGAGRSESESVGAWVEVRVGLSPEFSARPPDPESAVFVFARAAAGPRIPLAAARRRAAELPFSVVLSDAMAMTPQLKLSQFPRVDIIARVSKSGQPQAGPGDLVGEAKGISTTAGATVSLTIDRRF